jgi:DnaJ family protein B protein 12
MTGTEEPMTGQFTQNFDSDEWAEEIFRQFFGDAFYGGFTTHRGRNVFHFRNQQYRQQQQRQNNNWHLLQLLPLVILFLMSGLSSFNTPKQVYSFTPTSEFSVNKNTEKLGVEYWVSKEVNIRMKEDDARKEVEEIVEYDHLYLLKLDCNKQRNRKNSFSYKAQYYSGSKRKHYEEQANSVDMTSCEKLHELLGYS